MNSASAADRGGRAARVDGGSVLLGAPGAPGCTTTGCAELFCCACAADAKKSAETLAASNASTARAEPDLGTHSRRTFARLRLGVRKIFIRTRMKSCHETRNCSTRDRSRQTLQSRTLRCSVLKEAQRVCEAAVVQSLPAQSALGIVINSAVACQNRPKGAAMSELSSQSARSAHRRKAALPI